MDTHKQEKKESILGASRTSKRARETESNSPSSDNNNIERQRNGYTQAREREIVSLERFEQAKKGQRQRATLPSATTTIERHTQAREREMVSLERVEQARKRERQRATLPSAKNNRERQRSKRKTESIL
jgi:hypothetical protein